MVRKRWWQKIKKIAVIFGTRPEAIKMAPVIKELEGSPGLDVFVIVTAQHRELLDQVLDLFTITPDYDLDIMEAEQSLEQITSKAIQGLDQILSNERPDMILVHGDTTTTFASALAGYYKQIPVGHVEAGLRTYNKYNPFPEEMNRRLSGVLAELHFAPTEEAKGNLLQENVMKEKIFVTGNTVIDALLRTFDKDYEFVDPLIKDVDFKNKDIILLTAHRRENLGKALTEICEAVKKILIQKPQVEVIFPMHPNPKVRRTVRKLLKEESRIHLIEPLEYKEFVNLMGRVDIILTDSGGIQEEAPSLGKPVLVLRERTERPEAITAGTVQLVGHSQETIISKSLELLEDDKVYKRMAKKKNPYGDGRASKRIREALITYFSN